MEILKLLILFLSAFIIGKIFFKNNNFGIVLGIFIIIQAHIILSLIFGTKTSQNIIYLIELIIIFVQRKYINKKLLNEFLSNLKSLNIVEIGFLIFIFILGSQPQSHYDAVHANLYNAKWYFLNNSLDIIPEAISSLFPQNGIMYYSYFYGIGGFKTLQIAYLLPLVSIIFIIKEIGKTLKENNKLLFNIGSFLLICTPIFIFESINGYYDALVLLVCLAAISLFLFEKKYTPKHFYISSFIIGFGAAIKYFPIVFFIVPIFFIFKSKFNIFSKLKIFFISTLLVLLPLSIWCTRTYIFTGNPVFPFAQKYFPTPKIWDPNEILENNFMIQTPMSAKKWLSGGFIYYPFQVYKNTEQYVENIKGFPTRAPIFFTAFSVIFMFTIFYKIFKKQKIDNVEIILIFSFISLLTIGIITRYYRYLWPFQFIVSFVTFYLILKRYSKSFLTLLIILFFFVSNCKNLFDHYKFIRIPKEKILNPNYYQTSTNKKDPIVFINQTINNSTDKKILDASKYMLPRVNFTSKTYQCTWYWIGWKNIFKNTQESEILNNFDIIITNNPIEELNNYCRDMIIDNRNKLKEIYKDQYYLIYAIEK